MGEILRTAVPVSAAYLGIMLMGFVDLIVVGRLGPEATGAVGLSTSFHVGALVLGVGLIAGMDYFVASSYGAGRLDDCRRTLAQGNWIAVAIGLPFTGILILLSDHLDFFGVNPALLAPAAGYLKLFTLGLLPSLVFAACRNFLQCVGEVRVAMHALLWTNILNLVLNYLFVFKTPLGLNGSAIATLFSRLAMMAIVLVACRRWVRRNAPGSIWRFDRARMKEVLGLGWPSSVQMCLEVGVFATATTLAGRLDPTSFAAHNIVLNIASLSFMVPLGIGASAAALVGKYLGADDPRGARRVGNGCIYLGVGFMAFSALALWLGGADIVNVYSDDRAVIELGAGLLILAALFQVSDGAQTVLTGALRGLGDTRSAMFANLAGHWLVGLPLGLFLCFQRGYGIRGLWTGLAMGITAVAIGLSFAWVTSDCRARVPRAA